MTEGYNFKLLSGLGLFVISTVNGCSATEQKDQITPQNTPSFQTIYEPSGIVPLANGTFLVIEDEARTPMSVVTFGADMSASEHASLLPRGLGDVTNPTALGKLDDLEGIARGADGYIYAITSHSKTSRRRLPNARKKLIRFQMDGTDVTNAVAFGDIKKEILSEYGKIKKAIEGRKSDLNVESLSVHRQTGDLLIGLRSPLIKDQAVVIALKAPEDIFGHNGSINLASKPIYLDLDRGGIRAMAYDETLGGYLIISRREGKKDKSFKLWLWSGQADEKPSRLKMKTKIDLNHAEGIAPIHTDTKHGVIIVFDDGVRFKRRGGHYRYVPYDEIIVSE